jgi:hypothetical protein
VHNAMSHQSWPTHQIICDVCGEMSDGYSAVSVATARKRAQAEEGFTRVAGRDRCADCTERAARPTAELRP